MSTPAFLKKKAKRLKISVRELQEVVTWYREVMEQDLLQGKSVKLPGIGTLEPTVRKSTRKLNPQTQKVITLPPRVRVSFRPTRTFNQNLDQMTEDRPELLTKLRKASGE